MAYDMIRLADRPDLKECAAQWFHEKWGIPVEAYMESMEACLEKKSAVPQWYLAMECGQIVGGMGVIENDFHDRKDLAPNVCAVYTEEPKRGQGIAGALLNMVCKDMSDRGIDTLYLVTDHTSFYERYGWEFLCMVQGDGEPDMTRMYVHRMPQEKYYTTEDFYNMPEEIRAELIDGEIIYMASPSRIHQEILGELFNQIKNYIKSKNGRCHVYPAPFGVQLNESTDTVLEPDISVICDPGKLNDRGCLGAPDWIIEIASPSNPQHDYITKLNLYNSANVREYWIVDPQSSSIYVYNMDGDRFCVKVYSFDDTVKVGIYEDLYIDFSSLDFE